MNFKKLIIAFALLSFTILNAEQGKNAEQASIIEVTQEDASKQIEISQLLIQKETIQDNILNNNIWSKIYSNFHTYQVLQKEKVTLDAKIKRLESMKQLTKKQKIQLEAYKSDQVTLLGKLQLLIEYEKDPFKKFITPPVIEDVPNVESPFSIIGAISYYEKLESVTEGYNSRYVSLELILEKFKEKQVILKKLLSLDPQNELYIEDEKDVEDQIKTFIPIIEIFETTKN